MGRLIFDFIIVCIAIALSAFWLSVMAYGNGIGGGHGVGGAGIIEYIPIIYAIFISIVTIMHVEKKAFIYSVCIMFGSMIFSTFLIPEAQMNERSIIVMIIGFPILIWAGAYSSFIFTENEEDDRDRTPHH